MNILFRYRVANTKYEELIERRDQELDQMQRAWEIQPSSIALGEAIAEGSYGEVSRGVYHTYDVAVKVSLWKRKERPISGTQTSFDADDSKGKSRMGLDSADRRFQA